MTPQTACLEAKKKIGVSKLARFLHVSRQAVSKWRVVPIGQIARVSELTGIKQHHFVFIPQPKDATNGQAQGRRAAK